MSDPEHFLTRWSRLKRQGGEPAEQERPEDDDAAPPAQQESAGVPADSAEAMPAGADAADQQDAFDPASLPPIESITAATDIRPFLAPGVPAALTRAALRRAWTADPKIRDFIEIAENQWDFATPDSVPGFASFQPGDDVSRYIAQLEGKVEDLLEEPAASPAGETTASLPAPDSSRGGDEAGEHERDASAAAQTEDAAAVVHCNENDVATPKETAEVRHAALATRRARGRALPQ
jgi:hypothetical protein